MTMEPDGRAAVPISLNGRNVQMLLDTGSPQSVIASAVIDKLQLARHALPEGLFFQFYSGVVLTEFVRVDTMSLNGHSLPSWRFIAAPDIMFAHNSKGLFGEDFLSAVDLDLDFGHRQLGLISSEHCPGRVVYWTHGDYSVVPMRQDDDAHIYIDVVLDGHEVEATVDTGAADSAMTLKTARHTFDLDEDDPALKPAMVTDKKGDQRVGSYSYPFSSLSFGDVVVENPQITIIPTGDVAPWAPKLLLGMNVLRQLHVYIAYKEKRLYLTSAEAE